MLVVYWTGGLVVGTLNIGNFPKLCVFGSGKMIGLNTWCRFSSRTILNMRFIRS